MISNFLVPSWTPYLLVECQSKKQMVTEFFKNCIFKDSERISDIKLQSKLVQSQIIKPFYCVLNNSSLKNSYRNKIQIKCMTSAIILITKKLILSLPNCIGRLCPGTGSTHQSNSYIGYFQVVQSNLDLSLARTLTKGYNALIHQ